MIHRSVSRTNMTFRRWTGLRVEEIYANEVVCEMEFKAQKLPANCEDFIKLTTRGLDE